MLEEITQSIGGGIESDGLRAYLKSVSACKLKGALGLEIWIGNGLQDRHLLCSTTYVGQRPYYRPWVELFCINHRPKVGGNFDYRDSKI